MPEKKLPERCLFLREDSPSRDKNTLTLAEQGTYVLNISKRLGGHPCNYCGSNSCESRQTETKTIELNLDEAKELHLNTINY